MEQQIIFEIETEYGTYRDALYVPENHSFTDQEIEAMKQERVNNWLAIIATTSGEAVQENSGEV